MTNTYAPADLGNVPLVYWALLHQREAEPSRLRFTHSWEIDVYEHLLSSERRARTRIGNQETPTRTTRET